MTEVELFIPCFIDQLFPQTAWNMVKLLERLRCKVHYNPQQTCCGQAAWNAGQKASVKPVAEKWVEEFNTGRHIVSPSASCTGMVKNYYGEMLANSSFHNKMKAVQLKSHELSEFIVNVLNVTEVGARFEGRATWHDSCSALRELGIDAAPRQLLANVKGLELVEMTDTTVCCGFGGTFAVKFESISVAMAQQKVQHALATGAEYLLSTDWSCLMHLDGYIKKNKLPLKCMHIADVLVEGWN